jgi:isopentenyl diphosphate isomerase/L-lactate dehydrogenase-like FMN-dependent dehydrogenase
MRGSNEAIARKIDSHADAEDLARRRQPRIVYQRLQGGVAAGETLDACRQAFAAVRLVPRAGIRSERDLSTTVLGQPISMPVMTAPTGGIRVSHPSGELAVARAVGAAGTIQVVSGMCGYSIEEIMSAATGPIIFQLWYPGALEKTEGVIERVKNAGACALLLALDTAISHRRERSYRERDPLGYGGQKEIGFGPPSIRRIPRLAADIGRHPGWLWRYARDYQHATRLPMMLHDDGRPMFIWEGAKAMFSRPPIWEDIAWVRERWGGPLVLKGILTVEDAKRAVAEGADAIVVSNHGGNMLDGARPSLAALPDIVDAVGDQVEVLLDSGVRRGTDVVKAVALGARAVLIGRSYVYAHAAAAEHGVRQILEVYRSDIDKSLALLGCPSIAQLDRSYVEVAPSFSWRPAEERQSAFT